MMRFSLFFRGLIALMLVFIFTSGVLMLAHFALIPWMETWDIASWSPLYTAIFSMVVGSIFLVAMFLVTVTLKGIYDKWGWCQ